MKTITITSVTVGGGGSTITLAGTVTDESFATPRQQTSIAGFADGNSGFARLLCLTDQALFVKRTGQNSVAITLESLAQAGVALEAGLTWPPRFSTQPAGTSVAGGDNATLTTVQNTQDELVATFAWQRSSDGGETWTSITGATTPNDGCTYSNYTTAALTITAAVLAQSGYLYRCVATNAAGSTTSDTVALTVTVAGSGPPAIGITTQPTATSCVHADTSASFTVAATGSAPISYLWQVSTDGLTGWTNLVESSLGAPTPYTGTGTATITVTPATTAQNGLYYRCYVTNPFSYQASDAAQLTVT